jgi:tRNA-specific 2-thiouridylase
MPISKPFIIVAMSGGVDSSVSALLLQQQGYRVAGLFMKNWEEDDTETYCAASQDVADAQAVCDALHIPLHTINFAAEYWDNVFAHFLTEYRSGRTPNPDILCNKEIKFKAFWQYAQHLGAEMMATGHYVRCRKLDNQYQLLKGIDANKDQSYFLYTLTQEQLARSVFPVGDLPKAQVRQLATAAGFVNHDKKDSTGICFIGERRFKDFLQQYLPAQPGRIETHEGQVIGEHEGLMYYTIGQRQGLKIGGRNDAIEAPWYVLAKDLTRNVLIVGQSHEHPLLFKDELECRQLHWVAGTPPIDLNCSAKIRYRQTEQTCELLPLGTDHYRVVFAESQRAVTPGQSIVFYQGDVCLGGGVIV